MGTLAGLVAAVVLTLVDGQHYPCDRVTVETGQVACFWQGDVTIIHPSYVRFVQGASE